MSSPSAMFGDLENEDGDLQESTLRLKDALKISELNKKDGFIFEVDTLEKLSETDVEEVLETGMLTGAGGSSHYLREYIGGSRLKSQAMMDAITADEKAGDFLDVLPFMTDLTPDGNIKKIIIREGTSKNLVPTDGKVIYHYLAYAEGRDGLIDSSLVRRAPNTLTFAQGGCIQGLFLGLQSMRVGEIAKFWLHYDMAYKAMGIPPRIPPKANILCVVEVLSVVQKDVLEDLLHMSADDRRDLPFEKILSAAKELKEGGNTWYEKKDYPAAIARYRKGIDLLDNYPVSLLAQEELRSDLLGTLYSNLAQAFLQKKEAAKACTAAKCGLRIPKYKLRYKLYFKFAKGKGMLGEFLDSVNLCRKAIGCLNSGQTDEKVEIEAYIDEMKGRQKLQEDQLTHLYKKMLGNDKADEEDDIQDSNNCTNEN